jgi:hypothetical protein
MTRLRFLHCFPFMPFGANVRLVSIVQEVRPPSPLPPTDSEEAGSAADKRCNHREEKEFP